MKVTVKRKSGAGTVYRNLSGDYRWRNARNHAAERSRNQRKVIRATLNSRNVRKGA